MAKSGDTNGRRSYETGKGCVYYDFRRYNTAVFHQNQDINLHIGVDIEVNYSYGPAYRELCPKCRIKWLKKALGKFEEDLRDGKGD